MNIHIKTAIVTIEGRETPLTRAMVNQFPYFGNWKTEQFENGECEVLGDVSLPDRIFILYKTPHGIERDSGPLPGVLLNMLTKSGKRLERIILTK